MIESTVLILTILIFLLVMAVVGRAVIRKQKIIGRPPIPVFYFILAKMLVMVNLAFLLMKGFDISVYTILTPPLYIELIALAFLLFGITLLFLSTIQLNKDLIFGLSSSETHRLQTKGLFSFSRHPFYLGFIFILCSSCLFTPNPVNIAAFLGAWLIHHFIMIKEEQFLENQYGEEYRQYTKKVKRYLTLK